MTDVLLPKMGMQTVEADVVRVFVEVGQIVDIGQALLEVESEKLIMEVAADVAGRVAEVLVAPGDVVEPGQALVRIVTSADAAD
ncbi:MAG TPA: biotin/lipoyl-containing protein [Candidatus Saccharimonadales bacterium]|nr:biotin/lipoyl-containing protein [Candidatus Saccharimonadales bacterium]